MCGIAGFFQPSGFGDPVGADRALAMARRIAHRGPDDEGAWVDGATGIALAHRRLAILDLSPAGHQPMRSASGRYRLVFNGEIYNHAQWRAELSAAGAAPAWRGGSDTETLLAGIEAWGLERALRKTVGMFALALWDREQQALTLARDRLGEKPLYLGWQSGTLLFGSELPALRAHPAFQAAINRKALAQLLRFGAIPAGHTIHEGIHKLPPGAWVTLTAADRTPRPQRYWSLQQVIAEGVNRPFEGDATQAVDTLERLLGDSVSQQMVADVPLGAFLSGGVDSSTVVALMQARASRPVRTFTVGFEDPAFDESGHARAVARHLGTDHTEIRLTAREAMEVVPSLPSVYGEPFADPSQIPTLLVSRLARQQVSVALSGDGGDELFAGYSRYRAARALWGPWSRLPPGWRTTAAAALRLARPQAWGASSAPGVFGGALNKGSRPWARRLAATGDRLHKIAGVLEAPDVDSFYRRVRSQWSEADAAVGPPLDRTAFGQKRSAHAGGSIAAAGDIDDVDAIASQGWPGMDAEDQAFSGLDGVGHNLSGAGGDHPAADRDADAFVHRMMATDLPGYLPDHVLTKVDRAAMATGLETRVPMLSPDLLAFAWQLPMACKWRDGSTKWVLRQVLARHVPDSLIDRPKQGFGVPLGDWLRGPLRTWAQELLESARLAREGYLHPASIQCLWTEHLGGQHDRGYALWNVLMFQAWLEHSGREDRTTSPQSEGIGEGSSEGVPSGPVHAPAFERRRA